MVPLVELDLSTSGESLESYRNLDLKVHFRLGPSCRGLDLLGDRGCAVADDLVKRFGLGRIC
jgi:hypothetical protein